MNFFGDAISFEQFSGISWFFGKPALSLKDSQVSVGGRSDPGTGDPGGTPCFPGSS
jgi:hypothetical protein